ncbi:TPA: DUF362 domain-containing protein, partial [Candidatus Bathyarchaeota archaeon]|nr:DUF362 domain-containing protein [Candidatus Bathyarchaeota archaeon]
NLKDIVKDSARVLIKVNLISTKTYETGVTTDPLVVDALIRRFREIHGEVAVIEADATSTNADEAYKATGLDKVCKENNVRFINLSKEKERVKLQISNYEVLKEIEVPKLLLDAAIISAAKMKTHEETVVTLGMKNMFGLLPEKQKSKFHSLGISKVIVDINTVLRSKLTVIDGFYALEGPGPIGGYPVKMDLIIAGRDPVATDATACRIMGIDPYRVYHIRRAYEKGFGEIDKTKINVAGEKIDAVKRKFRRN